MPRILQELKRRHVYKVATAYVAMGWLLIEVASTLIEAFGLPLNVIRILATGVFAGFPAVLVLAWVFDLTPRGIEKTEATSSPDTSPMSKSDIIWGSVLLMLLVGFSIVTVRTYFYPLLGENLSSTTENGSNIGIARDQASRQFDNSPLPDDKSVAIVPLANLSPNPENIYFAAGVHEELLNQLAKIAELRVISRTAVLRYQDTLKSPNEIARELNVSNIIEGSVRYADDRVRVTIQLIRASDDSHLWSETYERTLDDIFAIQTDIAIQVANSLQADLLPNEIQQIQLTTTNNADAYSLFLETRYLQEQSNNFASDSDWLQRGIANMRQAIGQDPNFALGYAELAALLYQQWLLGPLRVSDQLLVEAEAYANQALDIDPEIARQYDVLPAISRAYDVLASINFERRDWGAWEDYSRVRS